jgi:hypothetical protein
LPITDHLFNLRQTVDINPRPRGYPARLVLFAGQCKLSATQKAKLVHESVWPIDPHLFQIFISGISPKASSKSALMGKATNPPYKRKQTN